MEKENVLPTGITCYANANQASHKECFRFVNLRAHEKLFSDTTNGILTELETRVGHYHYFQAKREYMVNPTTTVEGISYSL